MEDFLDLSIYLFLFIYFIFFMNNMLIIAENTPSFI